MSEDFFRAQLETHLRRLDWRTGITKAALIDHLAADPPARNAISRALVDGPYFSPADVLSALPAGAWQEPPPPTPAPTDATQGGPALPEPLARIPSPVLFGAVGGAAMVGFVAGLIWLLRRLRQP